MLTAITSLKVEGGKAEGGKVEGGKVERDKGGGGSLTAELATPLPVVDVRSSAFGLAWDLPTNGCALRLGFGLGLGLGLGLRLGLG